MESLAKHGQLVYENFPHSLGPESSANKLDHRRVAKFFPYIHTKQPNPFLCNRSLPLAASCKSRADYGRGNLALHPGYRPQIIQIGLLN
ncbi:hypothetical protein AVEN_217135-1 [Araneus ventricosus]|uniref:Uncharacterized protein n=1 Tax=Araneus ventricosus TaxID=182803 RepID=A0A4Y2E5Y6_ARAVE|nr:hypothetical protein AVEN_217135-1 [Araneus ventricosus]